MVIEALRLRGRKEVRVARNLQQWLDKYAETHRNPVNKQIHWVCVPVIFVTVLCLLHALKLFTVPLGGHGFTVSGGWLLCAGAVLFYLRLSVRHAIVLGGLAFLVLIYATWAENAFPSGALVMHGFFFVVAWIGQFIGHKIEGAKPAFLDDLTFLLIGPLWVSRTAFRHNHG